VFDASNTYSNLLETLSLPSWREIGLPGHERYSLDDTDDLDGSPSDLDCLMTRRDTLGDDTVDQEYESSEDDSDAILDRLQESERLSGEDEARDATGNFKCSYVSGFHLALG
jgi:hypothetical protein